MDKKYKPTLSVDFDGTIVEHAFPVIGELKPGAKDVLEKLHEKYEIVISSCRTSALFKGQRDTERIINEMISFLTYHKIPFDRIDMGDEGKVVASHYIDDRAIRFTNWEDILKQLE